MRTPYLHVSHHRTLIGLVHLNTRSSLDDEGDKEEKSDSSNSGVVGAEEVFISGRVEVWANVGFDFAGLGRSSQESRDGGPLDAFNIGKTVIVDKDTILPDARRRGCFDLELGLRGCLADLEIEFELSKLAGLGSHNLLGNSSLGDGLGNSLLDCGLGNDLLDDGFDKGLFDDGLGKEGLFGDGLGKEGLLGDGLGNDGLLGDGLGNDGLGNDLLNDGLDRGLLDNNLGRLGDDLLHGGLATGASFGGWYGNVQRARREQPSMWHTSCVVTSLIRN
jgi:hypothetical protein